MSVLRHLQKQIDSVRSEQQSLRVEQSNLSTAVTELRQQVQNLRGRTSKPECKSESKGNVIPFSVDQLGMVRPNVQVIANEHSIANGKPVLQDVRDRLLRLEALLQTATSLPAAREEILKLAVRHTQELRQWVEFVEVK